MRQAALPSRYAVPTLAREASRSGTSTRSERWAATALQEGLTATFWLDPGIRGKPRSAAIRFSGHRVEIVGKPQSGDHFSQVETVERVVPGSGPISITTKVRDINPGKWSISAELINRNNGGPTIRTYSWSRHGGPRRVRPLLWYARKPAANDHAEAVSTGILAFGRTPGVLIGAWPAFVGLGVVVGLAMQMMLVARADLDVRSALLISLLASAVGLAGAKVWYLVLHRHSQTGTPFEGLCIQGFLVGAAAVLVIGFVALQMPVGSLLDASTPGLLVGMAIGRQGCFFGGCCSGRATASRWGLWASDRRLGARRIPTQLMESVAALIIGVAALAWLLLEHPPVAGSVFVAAIAVYTLTRQVLLPLRAEPRKTSIGRLLAMAAAAVVLIADLVLVALG